MSRFVARRAASVGDATGMDASGLRSLLAECIASGIPRRALLLRLSQLPEDLARPHHLRLARAALDPLTMADRARLFHLPNGDFAVVWRGEAAQALQRTTDAVLHLFADTAELPDPSVLMLPLSLPEQAGPLLQAVDEALHPAAGISPTSAPTRALDPPTLGALEAALARSDVSQFQRRREVCELLKGGGMRLRWEERFLSVTEIATVLTPDRAIRRDPWLFRRLTRTLDRRMLALLSSTGELRNAGPFGINLNVAAVLSPEFLRFDAALPVALRSQVVLGLLPADIMADPATFLFARDFARARGYRLLLHGVTADLLAVFPLDRLGLDLLQLHYTPDLTRREVDRALPDPELIVLSRCHHLGALKWGRTRGITLFQGRAVMPSERTSARLA